MFLQLEQSLFSWLETLSINLDSHSKSKTKIILQEQQSMKMFNGKVISEIIANLIQSHHESFQDMKSQLEKIDNIKNNGTPASRLYNWNILCELLKKIGIFVSYADKSKILNFQPLPLIQVLESLREYMQREQQGKLSNQTSNKIEKSNPIDSQNKDNNFINLLVDLLCDNKIVQKQKCKGIIYHICKKGISNDQIQESQEQFPVSKENFGIDNEFIHGKKMVFNNAIKFLQGIINVWENIFQEIKNQNQEMNTYLFLNVIRSGFISKNVIVVQKSYQILSLLKMSLKMSINPSIFVDKWIMNCGVSIFSISFKKHKQFVHNLIQNLFYFLGDQFYTLLQPFKTNRLLHDETQKLNFVLDFLSCENIQNHNFFQQRQIVNSWLLYIYTKISMDFQQHEEDIILGLIKIIVFFWKKTDLKFSTNYSEYNDLGEKVPSFLNYCLKQKREIIFVEACVAIFYLIKILGDKRDPSAKVLLKCILSYLQECPESRSTFIVSQFKQMYLEIPGLPGDPVVSIILERIQQSESFHYFQFIQFILGENRVSENIVQKMVETFTQKIFQNISISGFSFDLLFNHLLPCLGIKERETFAEQNLSIQLTLLSELLSSFSSQKLPPKAKTKLSNMLFFCVKCFQMDFKVCKDNQEQLFQAYKLSIQLNKKLERRLMDLLQILYPDNIQLQNKIILYCSDGKNNQQSLLNQQEDYVFANQSNQDYEQNQYQNPHLSKQFYEEQSVLHGYSSIQKQTFSQNEQEENKEFSEVVYPLVSELQQPGVQTFQELSPEQQGKDSHIKSSRLKKNARMQRILKFGSKYEKDIVYDPIHPQNTHKDIDEIDKDIFGIEKMELFQYQVYEENGIVEQLKAVMTTYRKAWKFLFMRYSTSSKNVPQDKKTINIAEIWKIFKDYNLTILKKEQSHQIVKIINESVNRRDNLLNLTYQNFQEFIIQACYHGYNKNGCGHLTLGEKIKLFVKQIRDQTYIQGGNTQIFQRPHQVYFQQGDVIKQFNKRLQQNPNYILPEGYTKVKHIECEKNYKLAFGRTSNNPFSVILQILDDVIFSCPKLNFHIIEPKIKKMQRLYTKPCLFKKIQQKVRSQKQRYLLPKNPSQKPPNPKRLRSLTQDTSFHPLVNFSLGIKLGLASVPITNRFIGDQVAYLMDDILDSVEGGLGFVVNKGKRKIDNCVTKAKREMQREERQRKQEEESKWRKRVQSLKTEVQVAKEKRKNAQILREQQKKNERMLEKIKKQEQMYRKKQQFERVKEQIQEKKMLKQQQQKIQKIQKLKEEEIKKKQVSEFLQKKKIDLSNKFILMKKQKQAQKQKETIEKQKERTVHKRLFIRILKKQSSILSKLQQNKVSFDNLWNSKDVKKLFTEYTQILSRIYEYLWKQQNTGITSNDIKTLSFNTVNLFAKRFQLIPQIIDQKSLLTIYNVVGKKSLQTNGINYKDFLEILFRISVKGKQYLNKLFDNDYHDKRVSLVSQFSVEQKQQNLSSRKSRTKRSLTQQPSTILDVTDVDFRTVEQLLKIIAQKHEQIIDSTKISTKK